ncbi:MAG: aspartate aminotransferase family protein, partial [Gemmatimonadota bacterium]
GVWVRDVDGNEYLDFFSGILTTSVGHGHPAVLAAARAQMERLGHASTLYVTEPQVRVAKTLGALAPAGLTRACFTNSGTEAVESAITAACLFTGRSEVIALRYAYSGRSALATGMTGQAPWRSMPSSIAGIKHVRAPYVYRSPLGPDATEEEHTALFISDLVETIETTTGRKPAALFAETILGAGGFIVPPGDYFRQAAEVIRSYGGLLIIDEVQTGFGRTGGKWFGIEHWGVEPDLMVMAKGIANGFPVGATLARDEIAEAWSGPSISTFGGNPVCMAAAHATLEVMQAEDVPARSAARGGQLRARLDALKDEYAWIGDVRGMGLMQALELVEDRETKAPSRRRASALLEATKEEGLLVGVGGLHGHVVRTGPSMLITEEETEEGLDRLARACGRADSAR